MANTKTVYFPYINSGEGGLYARVLQVATGYFLDNNDGVFKATSIDGKVPLTESSGPSVYYFSENRTVWNNGQYQCYGYTSGNYLFAGADFYVFEDREISLSVLLSYVDLIKKIEENSWELKMIGGDAYWICYDLDQVTPLIQFKCYDSNNNPSLQNIFKRIKQ